MQAQPSCTQSPCSLSPQQGLKARAPEALTVMLKAAAPLDAYVSSVYHQKMIRQFFSKMAWELEAAAPKSCSIHAILPKNSCDLSNPSHLFLPHSEAEISVKSKRYCFKNNFEEEHLLLNLTEDPSSVSGTHVTEGQNTPLWTAKDLLWHVCVM